MNWLTWHWKDLSKGCKIDPSNNHIGIHLKKLWIFEIFRHPMIRIVDKVVIIVFGYLRMISNSKGGSFYKFLEGDLEESRLECYFVSVWACEHRQVSPNKSFQEYLANIDKIIFDTWDGTFGDVEEYSTTWLWMINILPHGHGWTIFLNEKWMNFYNKWMPNFWEIMDDPPSHS